MRTFVSRCRYRVVCCPLPLPLLPTHAEIHDSTSGHDVADHQPQACPREKADCSASSLGHSLVNVALHAPCPRFSVCMYHFRSEHGQARVLDYSVLASVLSQHCQLGVVFAPEGCQGARSLEECTLAYVP